MYTSIIIWENKDHISITLDKCPGVANHKGRLSKRTNSIITRATSIYMELKGGVQELL